MQVSKEQAHPIYKSATREFIDQFLAALPGAQKVRSREPAAAWNSGGKVGYVSLPPWSAYWLGPDPELGQAPLMVSITVNFCPPPGLFYLLRSRAFRNKLGVQPEAELLESPQLELVVDPEELVPMASWLADWVRGQAEKRPTAPLPPIPFASPESDYDFRGDDGRWLYHESLWTKSAFRQYLSWYTKKKGC